MGLPFLRRTKKQMLSLKSTPCSESQEAAKARELTRRKSVWGGTLPGKLADCSEKSAAVRSILWKESAGGSAKQGRQSFQAIFGERS